MLWSRRTHDLRGSGRDDEVARAEPVAVAQAILDKNCESKLARRAHDVEILTGLIQREPGLATTRDANGATPLHHIIAQIRSDASDAETAIFEALAKLILKEFADPNAKDQQGLTPLFLASTPRAALLLLQHGARVNDGNNRGNTPLMNAVHHRELFEALLKFGADPHQANLAGESADTWNRLVQNNKA